jgi:ABC-type transport system substrate-binding protein
MASFDKYGENYMGQHHIGTGPFKFDSYTNSVNLKYVKNPNYWGKDTQGNQLPYLDSLETIYIADPSTMKLLAQSGEGDTLNANPGRDARDYAALGFKFKTQMNTNNVLVGDSAHPDSPWANQKVREAVEYAIDREAIANAFGFGYWQAPYQVPPRDCAAYNSDFTLARKFDPTKSKQLLTDAGYPAGFKTTIIVAPIGTERDVASAMQENLDNIGIQANLEYPDMGTWISNYMVSGSWHNAGMLMSCTVNDPTFTETLRFMDQMWGSSWLRTPDVTQAFKAAIDSSVMDFRLARAATDLLSRDAIVIPVYEGGSCIAYRPSIVPNFAQRSKGPEFNFADWWSNK